MEFFHAPHADFFALTGRQSRPLEIGVFADYARRVIMAPQERARSRFDGSFAAQSAGVHKEKEGKLLVNRV